MLVIPPHRKRSREENPEDSEVNRGPQRRPDCGMIHDFECEAYAPNTGIFEIRLTKAFKYNWTYVALFVYSNDFTPQGIEDLCRIQRHARQLKERRILPMAMSTDTVLAHQAFVQHIPGEKIDFPVLSDTVRLVSTHLQTLDTSKGCSKRAMFLINEDRTILIANFLDDQAPYPIEALCAKVHTP